MNWVLGSIERVVRCAGDGWVCWGGLELIRVLGTSVGLATDACAQGSHWSNRRPCLTELQDLVATQAKLEPNDQGIDQGAFPYKQSLFAATTLSKKMDTSLKARTWPMELGDA